MLWNPLAIPLLARICLVVLFPFSAFDKIVHWDEALKQATSSFLPGGGLLLLAAIGIELITPACIVLTWHAQASAWILALFCAVTAVLYHPFWKFPGFWSGKSADGRAHFWDFLKNFGLVGGLLLVVTSTSQAALPGAMRGVTRLPAPTVTAQPAQHTSR